MKPKDVGMLGAGPLPSPSLCTMLLIASLLEWMPAEPRIAATDTLCLQNT